MLNEKFICTGEDKSLSFLGAIYESENFLISLGYMGDYIKAQQANTFKASKINFCLKPKDLTSHYPIIGIAGATDPYDDNEFTILKNFSPITPPPITPTTYESAFETYKDLFALARLAREQILTKYFPKDATYI